MSKERELAGRVRSWLREDGREDADRVLNLVLDQLDATPQRPATWLVRRFPIMSSNTFRYGIAAVALVAVVLVGINLVPRSGSGDPQPATPTVGPTPTPTAQARSLPFGPLRSLDAGAYVLAEGFPVSLAFEVPDGWNACSEAQHEQGLCRPPTGSEQRQTGVNFLIVDNVLADPCDRSRMVDPPPGPTVDDLVAAISGMSGFEVSDPTDVTVGGFEGTQIEVRPRADIGCETIGTWSAGGRVNGVGADELNVLRILDVAGTRVVIAVAYTPADVSDASLADVAGILESIRIEP